MKKVLNVFVVLAIVVGLFVSLGVQGFAADGDVSIVAVSDEQLSSESIALLREQYGDRISIIDVNGLADGQSAADYSVAWTAEESPYDAYPTRIWPVSVQELSVGDDQRPVILVGVGAATTGEEIYNAVAALSSAGNENVCIVAIGPAEAAQAIADSGVNVDVFLTSGVDDTMAVNAGGAHVVSVGKDGFNPISVLYVDAFGNASVEAVAVPVPAVEPDPEEEVNEPEQPEEELPAEPEQPDEPETEDPFVEAPADDEQPSEDEPGTMLPNDGTIVIDPGQFADQPGTEDPTDQQGDEQTAQPDDGVNADENQGNENTTGTDNPSDEAGDQDNTTNDPTEDNPSDNENDDNGDNGNDEEKEPELFTLTYKPGEGATGEPQTVKADAEGKIALADGLFTPPTGKQLKGWRVGTSVYAPGTEITITENTEAIAEWENVPAKDPVDVTITSGKDALAWTKGGNETLSVSFSAKVDTVSVASGSGTPTQLTANTHYTLDGEGKTVTFKSMEYLDSLAAGSYTITVTFQPDGDTTYNPKTVGLTVEDSPSTPQIFTWQERSKDYTIDCNIWFNGRTPVSLDADFRAQGAKEAVWSARTKDVDYTISGNNLTFKPAMVDARTGKQEWPNTTYTFRVTFSDGSTEVFMVKVEGTPTAATQAPATTAPTATPATGTSPVTGDETPIALYVGILLALIAALAVVIIIVMKRRKDDDDEDEDY